MIKKLTHSFIIKIFKIIFFSEISQSSTHLAICQVSWAGQKVMITELGVWMLSDLEGLAQKVFQGVSKIEGRRDTALAALFPQLLKLSTS